MSIDIDIVLRLLFRVMYLIKHPDFILIFKALGRGNNDIYDAATLYKITII